MKAEEKALNCAINSMKPKNSCQERAFFSKKRPFPAAAAEICGPLETDAARVGFGAVLDALTLNDTYVKEVYKGLLLQ